MNKVFNTPMAKGEGGGGRGEGGGGGEVDATPTGFFNFSREWEELFLQTKFLAVGSSLANLAMKKIFRSDLPSWL